MREHEAIVQLGAPADEGLVIRHTPEPREERPQQQLLGQTHPGMRGHFKSPKLHQTMTSAHPIGGVKLINAKLRPMGISRGVYKEVSKNTVDQPGRKIAVLGNLLKSDLQFVKRIVASFIHSRMLAGRANKQS